MRFNTGISAMMEFVNGAYKWESVPKAAVEPFVLLLSPFAPHVAEELWQVRHSCFMRATCVFIVVMTASRSLRDVASNASHQILWFQTDKSCWLSTLTSLQKPNRETLQKSCYSSQGQVIN